MGIFSLGEQNPCIFLIGGDIEKMVHSFEDHCLPVRVVEQLLGYKPVLIHE